MKKGLLKCSMILLAIIFFINATIPTAFADAIAGEIIVTLGEDLSQDQKDSILKEMGIDDKEKVTIIYVTNEEEHNYLGDYIPASQIGSNALSSARIDMRDENTGITVTTNKITYITGSMYSNALATAGISGAEIYVTSGDQDKIERAKSLGVREGVNYHDENWAEQLQELAGGFDVRIDSALGEGFAHHLDLSNPGGRIVLYGGTAGDIPELNARKIFWKQLSILGTTMGSPKDFDDLIHFINEHKLQPVIDSVHSFRDAEQAIRVMENSLQFGKIVLKMDS